MNRNCKFCKKLLPENYPKKICWKCSNKNKPKKNEIN